MIIEDSWWNLKPYGLLTHCRLFAPICARNDIRISRNCGCTISSTAIVGTSVVPHATFCMKIFAFTLAPAFAYPIIILTISPIRVAPMGVSYPVPTAWFLAAGLRF